MGLKPEEIQELIGQAEVARSRAYCPYSKFSVGAAILTDKGEIVIGCNVENASYGNTICAERTAMTRCVAQQSGKPLAIAVVGRTEQPLTPCGICRQFLAEFNYEMLVISKGEGGEVRTWKLSELLPEAFLPSDLDSPNQL